MRQRCAGVGAVRCVTMCRCGRPCAGAAGGGAGAMCRGSGAAVHVVQGVRIVQPLCRHSGATSQAIGRNEDQVQEQHVA